MNNADMPAMPLDSAGEFDVTSGYEFKNCGLTKREHFAGLAMQAIASDSKTLSAILAESDVTSESTGKIMALMATTYADELLKQLEESK